MKIEKFKKKSNGSYSVELEDSSLMLLHEDLILKYELLLKKEISDDLKLILLKENDKYVIYNKAIKYIGIKMRSIFELENYLKKFDVDDDCINNIINKLIAQGYLNDEKYAISYVNDRINLSNDGPNKIRTYLKNNNISDTIIEGAISSFTQDLELEKINKLINKFVKNNNKGLNFLKRKIISNLIDLGYNLELINQCLANLEFDDTALQKKEYEKLYSKLSKKYSGKELEYKIKQKLYQKGFNSSSYLYVE